MLFRLFFDHSLVMKERDLKFCKKYTGHFFLTPLCRQIDVLVDVSYSDILLGRCFSITYSIDYLVQKVFCRKYTGGTEIGWKTKLFIEKLATALEKKDTRYNYRRAEQYLRHTCLFWKRIIAEDFQALQKMKRMVHIFFLENRFHGPILDAIYKELKWEYPVQKEKVNAPGEKRYKKAHK